MKILIIITTVLFCFINLYSQEPGYQLTLIDTLSNININLDFQNMSCYDENNCIVLGDQSSVGARIFKTTDGGAFWREIYLDTAIMNDEIKYVPDYIPLYIEYFRSGYVVVVNQDGSIIRSYDFGETWKKHKTLDSLMVYDFKMLDERRAILTSAKESKYYINGILYSDDSCTTFKKYSLPDSIGLNRFFSTITVSKNNDIYIPASKITQNPDYTKSDQIKMNFAGSNWQLLTVPRYFDAFYYFDNNVGIAWGDYQDKNHIPDTSLIFKTYNGGKDWSLKFKHGFPYKSIRKIKFWDDSIGYAFGKRNFFIKTIDQGESWYFIKEDFWESDPAFYPSDLEVVSKDIVYLMYGMSERLYKYHPIPTKVAEPVVQDFKLFPNPVSQGSAINLSYHAIKSGKAKIYISDIEGRELANLYNIYIEGGNNSFTFNVPKNISSGSYWLVIEMNGYCHVKMLDIID